MDTWFTTVNKPSFNPPNWLFAPVWTALYIMMGIAFYLIWKSKAGLKTKSIAIVLYSWQLTFNFLWSFIFFFAHQPGWALVDIIVLWLLILLTIIWFGKISPAAAWLLVPYICWVSFCNDIELFHLEIELILISPLYFACDKLRLDRAVKNKSFIIIRQKFFNSNQVIFFIIKPAIMA